MKKRKRKKMTPREKRVQAKIRELAGESNSSLCGADIRNILRKVR